MTPMAEGIALRNIYEISCRSSDGQLKWRDEVKNLTTNQGLDEILNQFWKGSAYSASHYVGLMGAAPTVASGDTMASHAGWSEFSTYSEANRVDLTLGSVVAQSVSNASNKAVFNMSGSGTVGGAFVATDSQKGGVGGILIGGAAFAGGDRVVASGDQIEITVTLNAASA